MVRSRCNLRELILLVGLFHLVVAAGSAASLVSELDLDPDVAKYRMEEVVQGGPALESQYKITFVMARIDGDGVAEFVTGTGSKLFGWDGEDGRIKTRWQINLPTGFTVNNRWPYLGAAADLSGDGIDEIYLTIANADRSEWRFLVVDLATEAFILDTPLPQGEDRRLGGGWDGFYLAAGTLADADGQGRPGVVLVRNVEYDAVLRGVLVVDPFNGEKIWEWVWGPNPDIETPYVYDLDGDGASEIIIYGHSPDNLGGLKINGRSDDIAVVYALSNRGRLLWETEIGPAFCAGSAYPADLDGDGLMEIVVTTRNQAVNVTNRLLVLDGGTGAVICQVRGAAAFLGFAHRPGPRPGTSWVYSGSDDGTIDRFLYENRSLVKDLRVVEDEPRCVVVGAVDILPEPGDEILVDVGYGKKFGVLNENLEVLAAYLDEPFREKRYPAVWYREGGRPSLTLNFDKWSWVFDFTERPFSMWAVVRTPLAVVAVLGLLIGIFLLGRSRGRRLGMPTPVPSGSGWGLDRDALYRIWRQLDDVRHEKIMAASRGLSRLVWLLEAYASDLGDGVDLRKRIDQLMTDFNEAVHPRLQGILRQAHAAGFKEETVAVTSGALASLSGRLHRLVGDGMTAAAVADERGLMKQELKEVEAGFLKLWTSLREYFSTDPVRMIEGMLVVREAELRRSGIEVELNVEEDPLPLRCLADSGDLRYVLDNLIENASRSMAGSAVRRLTIALARQGAEIVIQVADTGPGVPNEIRDKIFSGRFSARHGGGSGLFRSREILQRWGGEIAVADPGSGQGAAFVVHLRALAGSEAPGTGRGGA
jgi:signal transduction histidine kinase/outer membrane protein assembly factor BamB